MENNNNKKCEWQDGKFIGCKEWTKRIDDLSGKLLILDYDFCPYCGANIRKPVEIKEGMFGKFWDTGPEDICFGVLKKINLEDDFPYSVGLDFFKHFAPGLPEGFNQDDTPKEEK